MSCLFQSFAYFFPNDSPDIIRQKVCSYMALNKKLGFADSKTYVEWITSESLNSYVSNMRKTSECGGELEIQVFSELYNCQVICKNIRDSNNPLTKDIIYIPKDSIYSQTCTISWDGGHYEPVK